MKNKNLNIRVSEETLAMIKQKADACGISQSQLVLVAVYLAKEKDIRKVVGVAGK